MGASAGTGVRSFAEGGSTSTPAGDASAAPQRAIYQPQYTDYGLGATPQAQSFLGMSDYGNQMPTFTRPQAVAPQANYQVAYKPPAPKRSALDPKSAVDPNLAIINQAFAPPQSVYDVEGNYYFTAPNFMDSTQRNAILENPETYLGYAKYVQSGGDPSKFTHQAQPNQYMTQGQREALMKKQRLELSKLLPQARPDDNNGG
jgi:hypothetical protein